MKDSDELRDRIGDVLAIPPCDITDAQLAEIAEAIREADRADILAPRCDEPGCTARATCGTPSPHGYYRWVCRKHYDTVTGGGGVALGKGGDVTTTKRRTGRDTCCCYCARRDGCIIEPVCRMQKREPVGSQVGNVYYCDRCEGCRGFTPRKDGKEEGMNAREILKAWLTERGYDGLWNSEQECACLLRDLAPCESDPGNCEPGYKVTCDHPRCDSCRESGWHMQPQKPKEAI